jgi:hypothetical protein
MPDSMDEADAAVDHTLTLQLCGGEAAAAEPEIQAAASRWEPGTGVRMPTVSSAGAQRRPVLLSLHAKQLHAHHAM